MFQSDPGHVTLEWVLCVSVGPWSCDSGVGVVFQSDPGHVTRVGVVFQSDPSHVTLEWVLCFSRTLVM